MERLKHIFPQLQITHTLPAWYDTMYLFRDEHSDTWLTIAKQQLSQKEYLMLSTFLTEVQSFEQWLHTYAKANHFNNSLFPFKGYAVHFHAKKIDETSFRMVMAHFFDRQTLYKFSDSHFIMLFSEDIQEELLAVQQILQTDLYTQVKIVIGFQQMFETTEQLIQAILREYAIFSHIQKPLGASTLIFLKQCILAIQKHCPISLVEQLYETLFAEAFTQQDVIESVLAYIYNQYNLSLTAKKLFIHRNTLLYRLQKFEEQTALKVAHFDESMFIVNAHFHLVNVPKK